MHIRFCARLFEKISFPLIEQRVPHKVSFRETLKFPDHEKRFGFF